MTPDRYCAERVGAGSNLHYSLLFATPHARRGANAVHAFVREVHDIADECSDAGVAQSKHNWWHEEIERMFADAPRHPVTQALAPIISARQLERVHFLAILAESARNVGRVRVPDFDSLHDHCLRAGGAPALLTARVFDLDQPATRAGIEMLGVALRLADIVCDLGQDVRRDRLFLPLEDLQRFRVNDADVLACRHTPAFESLLAFEIERTLRQLDEALARLPAIDRAAQLPSVILARLARAQLEEVGRDGYRVLERRVALTPLRKLWIAWRTRLSEHRRA
jgi:phytoene synthase